MGRTYQYECPRCGYMAKVAGRMEEGRDFCIQTVLCRNCKKLYDAVTRLRVRGNGKSPDPLPPRAETGTGVGSGSGPGKLQRLAEPPPSFETVLNQMPVNGLIRAKWVRFNLACPVSIVHKVQSWNYPGKCPLCGVFLEKSPLPFRVWE